MKITPLELSGLYLIEPKVFTDERGFFMESFRADVWQNKGIKINFVQDNHSRSVKKVLRGLHYQIPPQAQDKLVKVIKGEVFDVAVDIRRRSPTFAQWVGEILSADNKKQMLISKGFAHGFCVLSAVAEFEYKCSDYYRPELERGIAWDDPKIGINWPVKKPILSQKDKKFPRLIDQKDLF